MTFLPLTDILQRILEGLEEDKLDEIKNKFFPVESINSNHELAEKILIDLDPENRNKFAESIKLEKEKIDDIAKKCAGIEDKSNKSKYNELPILFDSLNIDKQRPANIDLRLGNEYYVSKEKNPKQLNNTTDFVITRLSGISILLPI
ncbi:MAG: hypothetical protein MUP85_20220 [Candidatus Lokiarchaeota archaeon]|nr:hypothetical protein [Candidatus Lokiarchaeota archaeon]